MTVSIKKWGNSLALRIPKDVAKTLHIENDSVLELRIENGTMIVEPQKDRLLEHLVSQIDANNLHREVTTGESVGNEEW
jgi:antitoxin MazE